MAVEASKADPRKTWTPRTKGEETTTIIVPKRAAALLQRMMALGAGMHTLTVLKNKGGAAGIQCWSLDSSANVETVKK